MTVASRTAVSQSTPTALRCHTYQRILKRIVWQANAGSCLCAAIGWAIIKKEEREKEEEENRHYRRREEEEDEWDLVDDTCSDSPVLLLPLLLLL